MEKLVKSPKSQQQQDQRKARPHPADLQAMIKCPRCASINTKFCYYNNYSLTQPRYFCKGCRRYWTQGGSLRNVPVGGGCRKNKRSKTVPDHHQINPTTSLLHPSLSSLIPPPPISSYDPNDLTLAFASNPNHSLLAGPPSGGFLDILRNGGFNVDHDDQASASCSTPLYYGFWINGEDHKGSLMKEMDFHDQAETDKALMDAGDLPWKLQVPSNGDQMVDSGRDFWSSTASGVSSSSWHGLINNPLM